MSSPKTLTLAQRFLSMAKARTAGPAAASGQASSLLRRIIPAVADESEQAPETGLIRRFFPRRPISHSAVPSERLFGLPTGEKLAERIRRLGGPERIRLDYLLPVPPPKPAAPAAEEEEKGALAERSITVVDVKKVLRASQMESARSRLRADARSCVSYAEYLEICQDASSSSDGVRIARCLDESGAVIVLGDAVFLHPDQLARVIESVVPMSPEMEARRRELVELEARKAEIDRQAEKMVKRELMAGLAILFGQTLGFMRLTFWELSWDVMEPICFYVTSLYFIGGYTFFLRTTKEPSFEGFFQSRFATKQRKLMESSNFDLNRFNELKYGGGSGGGAGGGGRRGGGSGGPGDGSGGGALAPPLHYKGRGGAWVRAGQ